MRGRYESMLWGSILPTDDPPRLARFYAGLLGWVVTKDEPGWLTIAPPEGGTAYLGFQDDPLFVAPPWPPPEGVTQQVLQFDLGDVETATARAMALGARLPDYQPEPQVRVLLDPAGHPFALSHADR